MEIYNAEVHLGAGASSAGGGENMLVLDEMSYVHSIKDFSKAKPIKSASSIKSA